MKSPILILQIRYSREVLHFAEAYLVIMLELSNRHKVVSDDSNEESSSLPLHCEVLGDRQQIEGTHARASARFDHSRGLTIFESKASPPLAATRFTVKKLS